MAELDDDEEYQKLKELEKEVEQIRKRREIKDTTSDLLDAPSLEVFKWNLKVNSKKTSTDSLANENADEPGSSSKKVQLYQSGNSSSVIQSTVIEKDEDATPRSPKSITIEVSLQEAKDNSPTAERTRQTLKEMDNDLKTLEREIENLKRPKSSRNELNKIDVDLGDSERKVSASREIKQGTSIAPDEEHGAPTDVVDKEDKKVSLRDKDEILVELEDSIARKYADSPDKRLGETYRCRFCGLTYNYMTTLKAHERVHDVEEPYVCNRCGLSYKYYSELQAHSHEHRGERGFKCECGRIFSKYYDLLNHAHPDEEVPTTSSAIALHMPVVGVPPDSEILSAKVPFFAVKNYPSSHKAYYCQFCCKSYATSNELKYHMYGHRGERQFSVGASRYLMNRL